MAFFLVTADLSDILTETQETYVILSCARQSTIQERVAHMLPLAIDGKLYEIADLPENAVDEEWRLSSGVSLPPQHFKMRKLAWPERTARMLDCVVAAFFDFSATERQSMGLTLPKVMFDLPDAYRAARLPRLAWPVSQYTEWLERFGSFSAAEEWPIHHQRESTHTQPHFCVYVCGANRHGQAGLEATLNSLSAQRYRRFSVRVMDEAAPPDDLSGDDWLLMLQAGDRLPVHALHAFASAILDRPDATMIYADDDTLGKDGRPGNPRFKPDWSLTHMRATDYIGTSVVLRGNAVTTAGGIPFDDDGYPASYELILRVVEQTGVQVMHLPSVLLHRAPFDVEAPADGIPSEDIKNMEAVRAHLSRSAVEASVRWLRPGCWSVRHALPDTLPLTSIIVPTRDKAALLRQCVDSLLSRTTYPNYEILVVDNGSTDTEALAYLSKIAKHGNVRVLRYDKRFNFSAINNFAVDAARGEFICMLNNDTEVISPDWLEEMTGHLLQDRVGAVGAKLFFKDGRVQHAGDTVGPGGCANHLHALIGNDEPGYCNRAAVAQELSAVTAACLLTRKDLYQALGGLDEQNLPVTFNDVDYCLRVREAGYKVVWTPHAELYHHESASRGKKHTFARKQRAKREARYMRRRWKEVMQNDPFYNPNFSYSRPDFVLGAIPRFGTRVFTPSHCTSLGSRSHNSPLRPR